MTATTSPLIALGLSLEYGQIMDPWGMKARRYKSDSKSELGAVFSSLTAMATGTRFNRDTMQRPQ